MKAKHKKTFAVCDGNEATAYTAYRTNEICVIYPITPASSMGELPDQWATKKIKNIWGNVPQITTMQSEGGAAGAVHGALQIGALATTFTSSQGLLLMLPNMCSIVGDLTPTVFHVATRTLAYHGMSIYGDHSDIYATRTTGFAMLGASSVQEAHDMALIAQAASLKSRLPFLHFFDGFRTSHEAAKIEMLSDQEIKEMIDDTDIIAKRQRRLTPENPKAHGVVSDYDIFFQSRERTNTFYNNLPKILEKTLQKFKAVTGRAYKLIEYYGDPKATQVIVVMGSAAETVQETVNHLNEGQYKVGVIKIRLFRPFPKNQFIKALPKSCKSIAVLDRAKEAGAAGEPLYEEVATTILENRSYFPKTKVIGGRFGIASKEFTPAMVKAIFDELKKPSPKNHFTIGITDDVTHTSLKYNEKFDIEPDTVFRTILYGLGADGTLSSTKNTIKIIGKETKLFAQGYAVFDAKKTGSRTISHLRFSPKKIRSAYLIKNATFIGCHQFNFIEKIPVLKRAAKGATFLLNSPYPADTVWDHLPRSLQQTIIDKKINFFVIDAYKIAHNSEIKNRINTIMQTCFFALSEIIPIKKAVAQIKTAIKNTYHSKGEEVLQKNYNAVDDTLCNLAKVKVPKKATSDFDLLPTTTISNKAPKFVQDVIGKMLAGCGDELPVSALPPDGIYPTDTACWEKRNTSPEVPAWIPENCIQCGLCNLVCPHSTIRSKSYDKKLLKTAPENFLTTKCLGKTENQFTLQVYPEDCTGCGTCVALCPINKNKSDKKALLMQIKDKNSKIKERLHIEFFTNLPSTINISDKPNVKDLQHKTPMFEFCGGCAGCGEMPYTKILTQLFGNHLVVANGVGCTLVQGGYLPTIPWTKDKNGRGPALSTSLFEDNAEFAYGILLSIEKHRDQALELLEKLSPKIKNQKLIQNIITSKQKTNQDINAQRESVSQLKTSLKRIKTKEAKNLLSLADHLIKQSVWALGGDGWAYDIGYGGLDHVLASGRNIKVLVLDTEVYSNTGGQASKATPRSAVAKFATNGKPSAKKDLGLMLIPYGNVYVASVAMGANPLQTIRALEEAENYDGPAIVIAYSHCISHGIDMCLGMEQQKLAVKCGHWPLYRYNPDRAKEGLNPLQMDSAKASIPFSEYAKNENRYKILMRAQPEYAKQLMDLAQKDIEHRWKIYEALSKIAF